MEIGSEIKLTPMMEQWHHAKNQHSDAILLFRMGDFYELFGEDAIAAAPILDLALTSRDKDKSGLKMAGFPHTAADGYIAKLVEQGLKVAICDQLEDPKASRGVVKRGITNVVTPATLVDNEVGQQGEFSFLVGIVSAEDQWFLCALDYLTASFKLTSSPSRAKILDEALRLSPKELIILSTDKRADELGQELVENLRRFKMLRLERRERLMAERDRPITDITWNEGESRVVSLVMSYIFELKGSWPLHIGSPRRYSIEEQLLLDEVTRNNLDLLPKKKGDIHNLFSVLDDTKTAMGRRALFASIVAPATAKEAIETRHDLVSELLDDASLRASLRDSFSSCHDLEKLTALAASHKISPRGMAQVRDCLDVMSTIAHHKVHAPHSVQALLQSMPDLSELRQTLTNALVTSPPINPKEGGIFLEGFDPELDHLRDLVKNGHQLLVDLETRERAQTNIPSLKIKYTRVFGYYIEVTKTHLDKVPSRYQRKQTVANGERYMTSELSELEIQLSTAEVKAVALEEKWFDELRRTIAGRSSLLIDASKKLALLDLVCSFAELAAVRSYARPAMLPETARVLDIKQGRHPVAEDICLRNGSFFVPNDVYLNAEDCLVMLVTGPNMAGKSTIMRQVALIQIMAQIGSFVPARFASLSICDAIFARVGAADDIASGRSTFMVEMSETAAILSNASKTSLILLDEIGRGTSTYDGLSIAQAVAEHIHDHLQARTLFATHYHELTELEAHLTRLKNFHVEIEEKSDSIRFLYSMSAGPCLKSFGIQVARLSGLPMTVLKRSQEILRSLESANPADVKAETKIETAMAAVPLVPASGAPQLNLFHEPRVSLSDERAAVLEKILALDVNKTSPLQALNKLAAWQNYLRRAPLARN